MQPQSSKFTFRYPSTESYWLASQPFQGEPTAPLPKEADAVIIGAGLTGASAAYHLRQLRPDWRVVLLEARGVANGATGRNGGLMWPGLNDSFSACVERLGLPYAIQIFKFEYANVEAVKDFVATHCPAGTPDHPDMYFFRDGGLLAFTTEEQLQLAKQDLAAMNDAKFDRGRFTFWDREETRRRTRSDRFVGALQMSGVAMLWAAKLVFAIARAASSAEGDGIPVDIFPHTPVTSIADGDGAIYVTTPRGTVRTARVVHATNAWVSQLLPEFPIVPVRNQVMALHPPARFPHARLWDDFCISANDGYEYMSQRANGVVIFGGLRNIMVDQHVGSGDDSTLNVTNSVALRKYLVDNFPDVFGGEDGWTVEMEWSGIMGFYTQDRMPLVGPIPGRPGQFISAGYTGHGMPRAFLCGRAIAEMTADRPVSDWFVDLFLPSSRKPVSKL